MNNLEDLNQESSSNFSYEDTRSANVTFYISNPTNKNIVIDENQPHDLHYGDLRIKEIIGSSSASVTVRVDLSTLTGDSTLTINNKPDGVVVTESPANNFVITGINKIEDFESIAQNTVIQLDFGVNGVFSYTPQFSYNSPTGMVTKTWTVNLTVNEVVYLTSAPDFNFIANAVQDLESLSVIDNSGVFDPTWTLTITPSTVDGVNTMSSSYVGGTSSFNPTTKVLTLTGNTAEMNNHLQNISVTFEDLESDFSFVYNLTNDLNSDVDIKTQNLISGTTNIFVEREYLSNQANFLYDTDVPVFDSVIDTGIVHTIKLIATNGELSYPTNNADSSTYITPATSIEFSGIYSSLLAKLPLVKFYPDKNFASTTSIVFELYTGSSSSGTLITSGDFNVNYAGAGTIGTNVYGLTINDAVAGGIYPDWYVEWTPTFEEVKYCVMDYLVIGACGLQGGGNYGGGAGGGEVLSYTNVTILDQTYTCRPGHEGTNYHTLFNSHTARNGNNGANGYTTGGNGGSNDLYAGGAAINTVGFGVPKQASAISIYAGGGGAGNNSAGQAATVVPVSGVDPDNAYVVGGTGGAGYYSNITGTGGKYYGVGAPGSGYRIEGGVVYGQSGTYPHPSADMAVAGTRTVANNFGGSGTLPSGSPNLWGYSGGVIIQTKV